MKSPKISKWWDFILKYLDGFDIQLDLMVLIINVASYFTDRINTNVIPTLPLPTKTYTTLVPIFAKKRVFLQWEARIREIKKKGHFAGMSPRSFEKG